MSFAYRVSCPAGEVKGTVILEPSKSISNRALIIRSLCQESFLIHYLSTSDDTEVLVKMLGTDADVLYSGHAGSSYRFMVARACLGEKEVTLDAAQQLRRRPIGPLVRALQVLGADITYLNKEGFPPIRIRPSNDFGKKGHEVTLQAGISSQYVTALLLIAPYLTNGLTIHLGGTPVSASYIQMTLSMMGYFGVPHTWTGHTIHVPPGKYQSKPFTVEGDWSAASYYYSMMALAEKGDILLQGLYPDSIQGDAVAVSLYQQLGVETTFTDEGVHLHKVKIADRRTGFIHDFSSCPDLALTLMVTLAGLGVRGTMSGLRTLRIKETDRIAALQTELARVKTTLEVKDQDDDIVGTLQGKASWKDKAKFHTYEDHRMAMAFTPLACIRPILIRDPDVVSKSYPGFWKDVESVGMKVEKLKL